MFRCWDHFDCVDNDDFAQNCWSRFTLSGSARAEIYNVQTFWSRRQC
jgi:hypothetical protein